ncbi:MAG TPA: APC family permease [Streptosporangiaceae bacterium]|jgi:amino acid transporter|nr:APC family permease [Streptosporangiaceae bacterium]
MATQSVTTPQKPTDIGLKRDVGLIGALWASEGSIIGSGWLFGALGAIQLAGTAGIISWVITGVIFSMLALVYAELGGMYPVAGGTARFQHYAFGSVAGVSFGFFSWLQAAAVAPVECYSVMRYGSYYWHGLYSSTSGNVTGLGFVMTIILMAIFTALNFLAVKWLAYTNSGLTWWKVAVPLLAIIVLFTKFHSSNFGVGGFMPYGWHGVFSAISVAGVAFALLGFEQADQLAGEIKNPQRNLPAAILGGFLIGTLIYILLQVVFIGALSPSLLTHGFAGLACPATGTCATNISILNGGPFAALAGFAALGWLAIILRLDAFISPFGTGLIYQTSTSRVGYGLGRTRYYPPIFTWTDKRGVPWFSLIVAFVVGLAFLLPFPSWHSLISLITSATVLMYAGAPLSMAAFRSQVPEAERPYRMPLTPVLGPVAFIAAGFVIYWSGFETIWKLGIALIIGYVLIGIWMVYDKQRPPLEWKSAFWLPVYLIGMGIVSWQGQFGPNNTNRIPAGIDLLIIAAFSLVIYYWAYYSRLSREEMLKIVNEQSTTQLDPPGAPAI